jgi:hypothetical protein
MTAPKLSRSAPTTNLPSQKLVKKARYVGRSPWTAADAPVGFRFERIWQSRTKGVRRGRGRPPHLRFITRTTGTRVYCTRARLRHQRQPSNTANPAITKSKEDGTGVVGGDPKPSGCGLASDWACAAAAPITSQMLTVARLRALAIRCNFVPNVGCV